MAMNVETFNSYIKDITDLANQDKPEANLTHRFTTFIHDAFSIEASEFDFEKTIKMVDVNRRGRTDILFGDLVFEFKRKKNFVLSNREQLRDYLVEKNKEGRSYTGFFTDGLTFEVWMLRDGQFTQTDHFNLSTLSAESAFVRLDAYLFSQHDQKPTAQDVVARFGGKSPTFLALETELKALLEMVDTTPMIETWRSQWQRLLSRVYGSNVGSNDLFIRHTYLCQFAKLLSYASLKGIPASTGDIIAIVDGSAFNALGVKNIGEADFFSWVLIDAIKEKAAALFKRLAEGLIVYDLSQINQDLLKQLYQDLVDPQTRHDLGEFYTPDWLAELTLEHIEYNAPQSLYDPTCGSGSFLFSAILRLAKLGLTGWQLVEFASNNVVGTDVHPLAVTVARMNYLLALSEHMRGERGKSGLITIPVFMADSLIMPLENEGANALTVPVEKSQKSDEIFQLPYQTIQNESILTEIIEKMEGFANSKSPNVEAFLKNVTQLMQAEPLPTTRQAWTNNLKLLAKLKAEDRNGIWAYILKNMARPLALANRKFDAIVGNPPWLSYRYIKNTDYQKDVKRLYQHYKLLESNDVKLFTQMDLSTLFYALMRDRFLKPSGTLAFVMPRAVITGAKQHRPFQTLGFTRVLDLQAVDPLFKVPTCVLIQQGNTLNHTTIPAIAYMGKLPAHELDLDTARPLLTSQPSVVRFVDSDVRSPYYYERFLNGATLFPRNLCFVKPEGNASSPAVISDPDADKEAKVPYKGVKLRGVVADEFIYATLLSKHLMPFGYDRMHMVALPIRVTEKGLRLQSTREDFEETGDFASWDWFEKASGKWDALKKEGTKMTFAEQLNYRSKITTQDPTTPYKVIYNASGTNIASCVIDTTQLSLTIYGRKTSGFVLDHTAYLFDADSSLEAHYLCSILNADCVNQEIKVYQSQGTFGERHIHRKPFEACVISPFDAENETHVQLAALSQDAHSQLLYLQQADTSKASVVALRKMARNTTAKQLKAIDVLAKNVLGL